MGKKNKGRKVVVASAAPDRDEKPKEEAAANVSQVQQAPLTEWAATVSEAPKQTCEARLKSLVQTMRKEDKRQSLMRDLANHFFYLDNKLVEYYCGQNEENDFTSREKPEILDEEAYMFYTRALTAEVEQVLHLPFVHFWAEITKDSQVMDFLDALLNNVRKRNDVYKLQLGVLEKLGSRHASYQEPEIDGGVLTSAKLVKQHVNRLL